MINRFIQIWSWFGVSLILIAYALTAFGLWRPETTWYLFFNLVGALGLVAGGIQTKDWQPAVLNIVWALVAVISLLRLIA